MLRDDIHPAKTTPEKAKAFQMTTHFGHPARIDRQDIIIKLHSAKPQVAYLLKFLDQSWHRGVANGARPQIRRIAKIASLGTTARREHGSRAVRISFFVGQKIMIVMSVRTVGNRDRSKVADKRLLDDSFMVFLQRGRVPIV